MNRPISHDLLDLALRARRLAAALPVDDRPGHSVTSALRAGIIAFRGFGGMPEQSRTMIAVRAHMLACWARDWAKREAEVRS